MQSSWWKEHIKINKSARAGKPIKLKNTQGPAQVNNPKPKAEIQLHKSFVSKRYCSTN